MKVLTIESLRTFLEELERRYGKETYSKQEIDEKLKSSGGSVDLKELADRIPNFKYWLRIRQSPNQTITATVDGKEYTADVLIEKGKTVTVTVKADQGYKAGTLSKTQLTMTEDTEITVTEAINNEKLEAGSISFLKEYFINKNDFEFEVPAGVMVLELEQPEYKRKIGRKSVTTPASYVYFKVVPGTKMIWMGKLDQKLNNRNIRIINYMELANPIKLNKDFSLSWSKEINEHATDIDLTELGNKWIIGDGENKILVPDKFKILKVEIDKTIKYVKLGEKHTLNVYFYKGINHVEIDNKKIITDAPSGEEKICTIYWSDEIDRHAWDIDLSGSN